MLPRSRKACSRPRRGPRTAWLSPTGPPTPPAAILVRVGLAREHPAQEPSAHGSPGAAGRTTARRPPARTRPPPPPPPRAGSSSHPVPDDPLHATLPASAHRLTGRRPYEPQVRQEGPPRAEGPVRLVLDHERNLRELGPERHPRHRRVAHGVHVLTAGAPAPPYAPRGRPSPCRPPAARGSHDLCGCEREGDSRPAAPDGVHRATMRWPRGE